MKKLSALLTAAVMGWMGISTAVVEAGNYQPTNKGQAVAQSASPSASQKLNAEAGNKTAFYYDQCYTVPVCNGPICTPVVRCNSYCSPCGPRPYFPAVGGYGGYGGYGVGGYGGYGNYGVGYGGYGGYGGYVSPSYVAPLTPGLGMPYGSPMIGSPVIGPSYGNPGMMNPYLSPVGGGISNPGYFPSGFNGGFGANISPINTGYGTPVISQPVYTDPGFDSPFYP